MNPSDHTKSVEFESTIRPNGTVVIPKEVLNQLGEGEGARVRVRLTGNTVGRALRSRGVTEEEITHIASLQLESREQVLKFLLSEGSLQNARRVQRDARRRFPPR